MRNFTANLNSSIGTRLATEPLVMVSIDWTSGTRYYSDKNRTVGAYNCEGKIIDFGSFTSKLDAKATGQLESFSLSLSDTDGTLKNIIDSEVTLFRTVNIYLHYEGLAESDLGLIFKGKIVSPIDWDEGERILKLNLYHSVESEDVLLEIKETTEDFPDPDDIGTVLPLCFGTVLRVPAAKLGNKRTGKLLTDITSWTTWYREFDNPDSGKLTYKQASFKVEGFEDFTLNEYITLEVEGTLFYGRFTDSQTFTINGIDGFNITYDTTDIKNRPESDTDFDNTSCAYIVETDKDFKNKYIKIRYLNSYRYYTVTRNGVEYDQLVTSEELNKIPTDVTVKTKYRYEEFIAKVTEQDYETGKIYFSRPFTDYFGRAKLLGTDDVSGEYILQAKGKAEYDWSQLPALSEPLAWTILAGAKVRLYGYQSVYIPNSVPSTEILEVCARREGNIVPIPSSYYTKYLSIAVDVNGNIEDVTMIKLNRLLTLRGEKWDSDELYVSLRSSINSNTASDVVTWILDNRTNVSPDATTFATVASEITNYPSNFAILNQRDSIEAIKDIVWQARCGVYIEGSVMYIKYLSKEPASYAYTVDTGIIELKSMVVTKTESDDICTVFKGHWNRSYDESERRKITKENNKAYYPNKLFEADFTIYNIESLVNKSLDFYKNRYSNDWIYLRIRTLMYGASIQIFDNVRVNVPQINNGSPIIGLVLDFVFDKVNYNTELGIWLPLTNGDGDAYLSDSSDTMPDDVGAGLSESDYSILTDPKVTKFGPKFKTLGLQSPSNSDYVPTLSYNDLPVYTRLPFIVKKEFENYLLCDIDQKYLTTTTEKLFNNWYNISVQKDNPPLEWSDRWVGDDYYVYEDANTRLHYYQSGGTDYYVREVRHIEYIEDLEITAKYVNDSLIHVSEIGQLVWKEEDNGFVFKEEVDPFTLPPKE